MTAKLTPAQYETAKALDATIPITVYDLAGRLFGERRGLLVARAQSRYQVLKRTGYATNSGGMMQLTNEGRAALKKYRISY